MNIQKSMVLEKTAMGDGYRVITNLATCNTFAVPMYENGKDLYDYATLVIIRDTINVDGRKKHHDIFDYLKGFEKSGAIKINHDGNMFPVVDSFNRDKVVNTLTRDEVLTATHDKELYNKFYNLVETYI